MESPLTGTQALLAAGIVLLAVWAYRAVVWCRTKQFAQFPQPEGSLLFGHAALVNKVQKQLPPKAHADYVLEVLMKELGNPPIFVMDFRPFTYPMLIVTSGFVAEQFSRPTKRFPQSHPKSPTLGDLAPITGHTSILVQEGERWKATRRHFNPGFAPKHLLSLLPCILDKTDLFLAHLDHRARTGEVFELHHLTVNLTFDIIGSAVADADFQAQMPEEKQSDILKVYHDMMSTYKSPPGPGMDKLNIPLMVRRWLVSRRLDGLVKAHIRRRFAEMQKGGRAARTRSVLSLGLEAASDGVMDESFIQMICDQLKTFLFAGHDTTSVGLQWVFYEISRHPRVLASLRAELDSVFGEGAAANPAVVRERLLAPGGEEILSRLPYMSAVIKETLRLYPPASTARRTPADGSGATVTLPDGTQSPVIDGMVVYMAHFLIQRDRAVYGEDADEFVPERWLGNTDTGASGGGEWGDEKPSQGQQQQQGIPASSWRPFERGPRNCIGQELANIEFRVIMACTVARYDFEKVGLGELLKDEKGQPVLGPKGRYETVSDLYNLMEITAKPADGTRMRVRLTEHARAAASQK